LAETAFGFVEAMTVQRRRDTRHKTVGVSINGIFHRYLFDAHREGFEPAWGGNSVALTEKSRGRTRCPCSLQRQWPTRMRTKVNSVLDSVRSQMALVAVLP